MRAATYARYGTPEVIELRDLPLPTIGEGDVLIRTRAAVVGMGDWRMLIADPFAVRFYQGLFTIKRPVLGWGLSGEVAAVGASVQRFAVGDEVFGESPEAGGFAQFAAVSEAHLALKPERITHGQAAATPVAGLTALQGLRDVGQLASRPSGPPPRVLVIGAGGAVGSAATSIAKILGAHVTGLDGAAKHPFVLAHGADAVLDRATDDFTASHEPWDVILDMVGRAPIAACRRALTPNGRYVAVSGKLRRTAWLSMFGGPRMAGMIAKPNPADLEQLRVWLADGQLAPIVARTYTLERTADALRQVGAGGNLGAIVVEG
ncbi:Zinc-type alcohol dehydrogenase-like protein [Planctomycetes bacterium Poly30]|uniref:Zinc-type alcohol dehydrogenase-like protein n=1 Tax=Saltatorellus ferox TaxID=2528018 RepID=A0A518EY05_9BACT|nr:Zinc-type alcohol dehydrogenase-like protein [Planctomycetes bacterium Poly30]